MANKARVHETKTNHGARAYHLNPLGFKHFQFLG